MVLDSLPVVQGEVTGHPSTHVPAPRTVQTDHSGTEVTVPRRGELPPAVVHDWRHVGVKCSIQAGRGVGARPS